MSERGQFLYAFLKSPSLYLWVRSLLSNKATNQRIADELLQPRRGDKVLDVGCGPGTLRHFLGEVDYTGVDSNKEHIAIAKKNGFPKDRYLVGNVVNTFTSHDTTYDLIILMGILHHLGDLEVQSLLLGLKNLLNRKGRIVTFDGVYLENQHPISRFLLDRDAGKNVRTVEGYKELFPKQYFALETRLFNDLLKIPYDHFAAVVTRNDVLS